MLYLIWGSDSQKREIKFKNLIESLLAKKTDATLFKLEGEDWDEAQFEELILGQSLFVKKYIVAGRNLFTNDIASEFISKHLDALAEAKHIFIFNEEKIPTKLVKPLHLAAEKILRFDKVSTKIRPAFNVFLLGDALGARDRRRLWLSFIKALQFGVLPEEIYWQYIRMVKNMLAVAKESNLDLLKLHPFVLNKTKKYLNNFSINELEDFHHRLVLLYHQVRSGRHEMDIALERFILEV